MMTFRFKILNGISMPFRVDFETEEAFLEAVTKWNSFFAE